jgi:alkanesulfonate monooxygenase SsuD/methylene tetrahydromethanopterin reductase-like flavin-dependent oxidoreductase (luciferase family)
MPSHGYLLPTRGVVFSSDSATELAARVEADVRGLARRAERLGYDAVWVGDSVLAKPRLEPLTTLAAVAAETEAVDVGTAVYLPTLRNPVHVAHATSTVDLLAGGRLKLGVGVGVRPTEREEQAALGRDFEKRGLRLDETLDLLRELWTGETVTYEGETVSLDGAGIGFGPLSPPDVYVASAAFDPADGFPRTVRNRIGAHADGWLPISMSPDSYAAGLDAARDELAAADRNPESLDAAFYQDVVVAETEAAALAQARDFLTSYYPPEELTYLPEDSFSDDQIRRRGVFGPPEQVRAHLDRYLEAGVETFVTRFPAADQREQLRRFRDVVARGR